MSWKRPNIGSRVNREVHARFWERAEVRVLRATRQTRTSADVCDTTASPPQADMHRLVIVAEGPIGVYLLGTTTFEAAETMLSFEMQCDQEFGLFRSPFSSEWWPERCLLHGRRAVAGTHRCFHRRLQ